MSARTTVRHIDNAALEKLTASLMTTATPPPPLPIPFVIDAGNPRRHILPQVILPRIEGWKIGCILTSTTPTNDLIWVILVVCRQPDGSTVPQYFYPLLPPPPPLSRNPTLASMPVLASTSSAPQPARYVRRPGALPMRSTSGSTRTVAARAGASASAGPRASGSRSRPVLAPGTAPSVSTGRAPGAGSISAVSSSRRLPPVPAPALPVASRDSTSASGSGPSPAAPRIPPRRKIAPAPRSLKVAATTQRPGEKMPPLSPSANTVVARPEKSLSNSPVHATCGARCARPAASSSASRVADAENLPSPERAAPSAWKRKRLHAAGSTRSTKRAKLWPDAPLDDEDMRVDGDAGLSAPPSADAPVIDEHIFAALDDAPDSEDLRKDEDAELSPPSFAIVDTPVMDQGVLAAFDENGYPLNINLRDDLTTWTPQEGEDWDFRV
ncbi:hypothetical protein EXIGLDRAFT_750343 [Exidia glandulosa HHB12029]|uniref:Uncharacterized protein n=1 Tax=Exidia glandulosa HHB12029 TaxID=1314781 RepID=A0A166AE47_EXIGL|nr:hypothetical protein EXIGLDRAFT_750343 [Exidia glandulosa HHB12029]